MFLTSKVKERKSKTLTFFHFSKAKSLIDEIRAEGKVPERLVSLKFLLPFVLKKVINEWLKKVINLWLLCNLTLSSLGIEE